MGLDPVLVYTLVLGVGLLVDAVLRVDLPPAVIPPVGLVATVVFTTLGFRLRAPALVSGAVVIAAITGFVLAPRARRSIWAPPAFVAGAPADADSLCGRPWDWIELVSGRS